MSGYEPSRLEIFLTVTVGGILGASTYRDYVQQMGLKGNERMLDFGSGCGNPALFYAPILQKGGGKSLCVDVSHDWMRVIQRRLRRYTCFEYRTGNIQQMQIADEVFDVLLSHFVLHDVPKEERPVILQHLHRVMAPDGRFFLREPLSEWQQPQIDSEMRQAGFKPSSVRIGIVPMMGATYEGVFTK